MKKFHDLPDEDRKMMICSNSVICTDVCYHREPHAESNRTNACHTPCDIMGAVCVEYHQNVKYQQLELAL